MAISQSLLLLIVSRLPISTALRMFRWHICALAVGLIVCHYSRTPAHDALPLQVWGSCVAMQVTYLARDIEWLQPSMPINNI